MNKILARTIIILFSPAWILYIAGAGAGVGVVSIIEAVKKPNMTTKEFRKMMRDLFGLMLR